MFYLFVAMRVVMFHKFSWRLQSSSSQQHLRIEQVLDFPVTKLHMSLGSFVHSILEN